MAADPKPRYSIIVHNAKEGKGDGSIKRRNLTMQHRAININKIRAVIDKIEQSPFQQSPFQHFGNMKRKGDKVKNTFTYTGREWDEEIGLLFYRARYRDPKTGVFISFDPILHPANGSPIKGCGNKSSDSFNSLKSKPPELNPYIYALDNPTNNIDPYGKLILIPFLPSTPPYPLIPPSPENCSFYNKDCECGNRIACAAYDFCSKSFDTFWFNCVRGCLKEKYLSRFNDYIWLFVDHPICYAACPPM